MNFEKKLCEHNKFGGMDYDPLQFSFFQFVAANANVQHEEWRMMSSERQSTSPAGQNRPLGLGGTASWNSSLFQIDPTLLQLDVDLARRSFTFETAKRQRNFLIV